jgi:hypothetical protein
MIETLPEKFRRALDTILREIKSGEDINSHLSRDAFTAGSNDLLLNAWRLHHLHVSDTKKNFREFFFDRSDYLAFVWFEKSHAYLAGILPHKAENVFARQVLLATVLDNWPELLEPQEFKNVRSVEPRFSDDQVNRLRNAHLNFVIEVKGRYFLPPGGLITGAGTKGDHVREIDYLYRELRDLQTWIAGHGIGLLKRAPRKGFRVPTRPTFELLDIVEDGFLIREKKTRQPFLIPRSVTTQ